VQGWAVDDDLDTQSSIGVLDYEYSRGGTVGVSTSGGTAGIAAKIYKGTGGSFSSGAVVFMTGTTTIATDGWSVHTVAFKAGLETKTITVPKNSGIWNSTYSKQRAPTYALYPNGFSPASFLQPGSTDDIYSSGSGSASIYRVSGSGTNSQPFYYDYARPIVPYFNIGFFNVLFLKHWYQGTTAVVNCVSLFRIWIAQPCSIRFNMQVNGRSGDYGSYQVWKDAYLYGTLIADLGYNQYPGAASPNTSLYTINSPCYIVIRVTTTLGGVGGSPSNTSYAIGMELNRV
jgi:hypothetical protein